MSSRPVLDKIPQELRAEDQWVNWLRKIRKGKPTKEPHSPNGRLASHSDPETWSSFERVASAAPRFDGIGFVLSDADPFGGIDLDHAIDPETGEIHPWALEIVNRFPTYWEQSPSGTGLRAFLKATLPEESSPGGRKRTGLGDDGTGAAELYCRLRYLTVTGRHLPETSLTVEALQVEFFVLYWELFPPEQDLIRDPAAVAALSNTSDAELLAQAFGSRNGAKIMRLWAGNTGDYAGNHSSADFALIRLLAFWTGPDPDRLDSLFRQSSLFRPKWDERRGSETYGSRTIAKVLAGQPEFYKPPSRGQHRGNGNA